MSINVNIDLVSPLHMRTFAKFLTDMADARDAKIAATDADRDRRWASEPAEAPDAAHVTTQENSSVVTPPTPEKKTRSRKPKDAPASSVPSADNGGQTDIETAIAEQAAISTGEERVGPEDSEAVAEQDAADEAAETAATKTGLTLDDVRTALGEYVRLFGMAAAQEDGPKVITLVCGEGKVKISDVADDKIAAVVSGVKEMTAKNPFDRSQVAA